MNTIRKIFLFTLLSAIAPSSHLSASTEVAKEVVEKGNSMSITTAVTLLVCVAFSLGNLSYDTVTEARKIKERLRKP